MIEKYSVRTDLALEEKERFESDNVEISGVVLEEDYDETLEIRYHPGKDRDRERSKSDGKACGSLSDAGSA